MTVYLHTYVDLDKVNLSTETTRACATLILTVSKPSSLAMNRPANRASDLATQVSAKNFFYIKNEALLISITTPISSNLNPYFTPPSATSESSNPFTCTHHQTQEPTAVLQNYYSYFTPRPPNFNNHTHITQLKQTIPTSLPP